MNKQKPTTHSTSGPGHGHGNHGHSHGNHSHHSGHHHDFKGIEQWIARLDTPEREKKQRPQEVIAKLGLQGTHVVADIGAGTGYFAIRIAEAYPQVRVLAADSEPEMVAYLKSQAAERNLANLDPLLLDPTEPNLPVQADLALIVDTFHHMHNRVEYLKSLRRSMAPGSRIAIIDYSVEALEGPPADHRISIADVVEELKQAGFRLEQDFGFLPDQYFLIFRQE